MVQVYTVTTELPAQSCINIIVSVKFLYLKVAYITFYNYIAVVSIVIIM